MPSARLPTPPIGAALGLVGDPCFSCSAMSNSPFCCLQEVVQAQAPKVGMSVTITSTVVCPYFTFLERCAPWTHVNGMFSFSSAQQHGNRQHSRKRTTPVVHRMLRERCSLYQRSCGHFPPVHSLQFHHQPVPQSSTGNQRSRYGNTIKQTNRRLPITATGESDSRSAKVASEQ